MGLIMDACLCIALILDWRGVDRERIGSTQSPVFCGAVAAVSLVVGTPLGISLSKDWLCIVAVGVGPTRCIGRPSSLVRNTGASENEVVLDRAGALLPDVTEKSTC